MEKLKAKVNKIFERIDKLKPKEYEAAFKGYLESFRIDGQEGVDDLTFINNIKANLRDLIYSQKKLLKTKCVLTSKFHKTNPATGQVEYTYSEFHSRVHEVYDDTDITELVNTMTERVLENVATFQNKGSGWQFDEVISFDIHIDPFETVAGSSYLPLPKVLAAREVIINVKNTDDNECFKWSITSAVYPRKKDP